jgi:hypothetical protein
VARSATPAPRRVFERIKSEPADQVVARFKMVIGICNLHHQIRMASFGVIEPASHCLDGRAVLPGPQPETADGLRRLRTTDRSDTNKVVIMEDGGNTAVR